MSFVWFADKPLNTREQIAPEVPAVSLGRRLDELATVITHMTISTEVGYNDSNGQRQWWCPWSPADPQTKKFQFDSESETVSRRPTSNSRSPADASGKTRGGAVCSATKAASGA